MLLKNAAVLMVKVVPLAFTEATVAVGERYVAATTEVLLAVAFTSVPGLLPVMSVKDVFAVMVPMRVLFGMPVPVTNMFV